MAEMANQIFYSIQSNVAIQLSSVLLTTLAIPASVPTLKKPMITMDELFTSMAGGICIGFQSSICGR